MRFATFAAQKRFGLLVLAGMLVAGGYDMARAESGQSFVIPASENDGYGISDCLRGGGDCGRVVADSYCEAHGLGKAIAFGAADDVTGAIAGAPAPKLAAGDSIIRCGD